MSTTPSIGATAPANAIASMARSTTPEELAQVTGWDAKAVRAAIRDGALPGCRYIPSATNSSYGRYLCAWAPFAKWWSDGVESGPAPKDETVKLLHRIERLDTVRALLQGEAVS